MGNVEALVLCRTPFQAFLLREVLKQEKVSVYDLIYLTQDDSEEDRHYYTELSSFSRYSQYVNIKTQRYDILNHIRAYKEIEDIFKYQSYGKLIVASINQLAFSKMTARNDKAELISFDDGAAHIVKNSVYFTDKPCLRMQFYKLIFRVPGLRKTRNRICRHYSIYPGFKHLFPKNILWYIDAFKNSCPAEIKANGFAFFIGQPFKEVLDTNAINNLKNYISGQTIDFYVRHPREIEPLVNNISIMKKDGRIAEEAIFDVCKGKRPLIFGWFSSVMINISSSHAKKIMLLPENESSAYYAELGQQAGCQVVLL